MIEVTDEMVQLIVDEIDFTDGSNAHDEVRRGLAAVLAIVERDNRLDPICRAELMPDVHCARPAHVRGDHESALPGGSAVKWS